MFFIYIFAPMTFKMCTKQFNTVMNIGSIHVKAEAAVAAAGALREGVQPVLR